MENISAQPEQVRTLLEYASDDTVEKVLGTGATIDEVMDAIQLVAFEGTFTDTAPTVRVQWVCAILLDAKRQQRHTDAAWRPGD
jgi:hypothetical protein